MSFADSNQKAEIIKKHRVHETDSGSPEVQIALLTGRLEQMSEHFKTHVKDNHSRRGMMNMINRRKRLLAYLKREDLNRYKATIAALGLRK
jgi:small subunit ribosomal protein S15